MPNIGPRCPQCGRPDPWRANPCHCRLSTNRLYIPGFIIKALGHEKKPRQRAKAPRSRRASAPQRADTSA